MAKKREKKDKMKQEKLEDRIDMLERTVKNMGNKTYEYLTGQIVGMRNHNQQLMQSIQLFQEYMRSKGLEEDFKDWAQKKFEAMQQPKEPAKPPAKENVCDACHGRGYIGDDEECPKCHPNKVGDERIPNNKLKC